MKPVFSKSEQFRLFTQNLLDTFNLQKTKLGHEIYVPHRQIYFTKS